LLTNEWKPTLVKIKKSTILILQLPDNFLGEIQNNQKPKTMIVNPEDIREDVRTLLKRKQTDVHIEGDRVLVNLGWEYPYEIPLSEVNTDSDILRFVLQLCSKKGADTVTIEAFIEKMHLHRNA
jgi:hypothetical protein